MTAAHGARILEIPDEKAAREEIAKTGASPESVSIMAPKAVFYCVRLDGVRCAAANILKQEMLAAGGDAAVSSHAVDCSAKETPVLLMGTAKQFRVVLGKMRGQGSGIKRKPEYAQKWADYYAIADEIETVLKSPR